jgi:hypothetical protein
MPDEKRIARYSAHGVDVADRKDGYEGWWIKEDDLLDALGEVETKHRNAVALAEQAVENEMRVEHLNAELHRKLESLRSGLKAEILRLNEDRAACHGGTQIETAEDVKVGEARYITLSSAASRLQRLLDASEDTEKQSGGGGS